MFSLIGLPQKQKSFFKIASVLFGISLAIFLSQPAHADDVTTRFSSFVKPLSFDELMQLSPQRRETYVLGLRTLFKELDRLSVSKSAAADVRARRDALANFIFLYDRSIASAEANDGVPSCGDGRVAIANGNGTFRCMSNFTCPAGQRQILVGLGRACAVGASQTSRCGAGFVAVNQGKDSGRFTCVTQASFAALDKSDQFIGRRSVYVGSTLGYFGSQLSFGLVSDPQANFRSSGPSAESLASYYKPTRPEIVPSVPQAKLLSSDDAIDAQEKARPALYKSHLLALNKKRAKMGLAPLDKLPPSGALREAAETGDVSPLVAATKTPTSTVPSPVPPSIPKLQVPPSVFKTDTHVTYKTKPVARPSAKVPVSAKWKSSATATMPVDESDAFAAIARALGQSASTASSSGSVSIETCSPEVANAKSCRAGEIAGARTKYLSDKNPDCIYAGNVSGYEDGQKRAYKCEPPHDFCFGSKNCKADSGEAMKPDYSCGPRGVICNPLLFGVKSDGKTPFCISRTTTATASCDEKASAEPNPVKALDQKNPGLREAWNDFADRLFGLCNASETAKVLYCEECKVIRKRLFFLNMAVRNLKTCGAAEKFEALTATGGSSKKKSRSGGAITQETPIVATDGKRLPANTPGVSK